MEDAVLQYDFDIDDMFSTSKLHQYANMEYNNDPPTPPLIKGTIPPSNN